MGISRVYLDSYYLLEMITRTPDSDVKKLLYTIKSNSFEIFVPQIVLGEVVAKIFTKPAQDREDALSKLHKVLQDHGIDPASCMPPPQGAVLEIARCLRNVDSYLYMTDVLIISHALADPNSKFFFTPDSKLTQNHKILECEKRLRDDNKRETELRISDGL